MTEWRFSTDAEAVEFYQRLRQAVQTSGDCSLLTDASGSDSATPQVGKKEPAKPPVPLTWEEKVFFCRALGVLSIRHGADKFDIETRTDRADVPFTVSIEYGED